MMPFHCMIHVVQLRMHQFWIRVGVLYRVVVRRNDWRYWWGLVMHRVRCKDAAYKMVFKCCKGGKKWFECVEDGDGRNGGLV